MTRTLIPPDGGYGWVIVFASVLNNFLMVPLIQNVVLIFKDKMLEIDMTVTQMWFALNVHTSFIYITHLLNNLLLTRFGYRKVTLAGVSFVFCGLSMSSWIHNYLGFMLTFGFVTAAQRRGSTLPSQPKVLTKTTWWKSEESINLESCYDIFEENESLETIELNEQTNNSDKMNSKSNGNCKSLGKDFQFEEHKIYKDPNFDINSLPWYKRHLYRVVGLLGLDIFLNLRYVNILIGLSLVVLVEMNFVVLLPFLLFEYSFTISEIAAFLSVLGAADIVFRFLPPHVGDCLKKPARVMIILVLGVIIAARLALIYISHYPTILIIALILGCSKGMRVVYMSLIIPSYVPEQHLASALVIQIVLNSLMSLLGGYAIGITRTTTGSYVYCVILLEFLTALTIVMWSADILIKKCSRKKSKPSNVSTARAEEVY
ncbi:hypothetical protein YQE_00990, partial [Dendroctonus ponderosae]